MLGGKQPHDSWLLGSSGFNLEFRLLADITRLLLLYAVINIFLIGNISLRFRCIMAWSILLL